MFRHRTEMKMNLSSCKVVKKKKKRKKCMISTHSRTETMSPDTEVPQYWTETVSGCPAGQCLPKPTLGSYDGVNLRHYLERKINVSVLA